LPAGTSWAKPTGQALADINIRATESDAMQAMVLTEGEARFPNAGLSWPLGGGGPPAQSPLLIWELPIGRGCAASRSMQAA
jgi:hypothetical protein